MKWGTITPLISRTFHPPRFRAFSSAKLGLVRACADRTKKKKKSSECECMSEFVAGDPSKSVIDTMGTTTKAGGTRTSVNESENGNGREQSKKWDYYPRDGRPMHRDFSAIFRLIPFFPIVLRFAFPTLLLRESPDVCVYGRSIQTVALCCEGTCIW